MHNYEYVGYYIIGCSFPYSLPVAVVISWCIYLDYMLCMFTFEYGVLCVLGIVTKMSQCDLR